VLALSQHRRWGISIWETWRLVPWLINSTRDVNHLQTKGADNQTVNSLDLDLFVRLWNHDLLPGHGFCFNPHHKSLGVCMGSRLKTIEKLTIFLWYYGYETSWVQPCSFPNLATSTGHSCGFVQEMGTILIWYPFSTFQHFYHLKNWNGHHSLLYPIYEQIHGSPETWLGMTIPLRKLAYIIINMCIYVYTYNHNFILDYISMYYICIKLCYWTIFHGKQLKWMLLRCFFAHPRHVPQAPPEICSDIAQARQALLTRPVPCRIF
jgi:hypothetical protein